MLQYINSLPNDFKDMINVDLMKKTYDKPLEEFIFDAFKGFEILPNIKILGYEWVPDEDKYDGVKHAIVTSDWIYDNTGYTTVFPIPVSVLSLNSNLTQNPGY